MSYFGWQSVEDNGRVYDACAPNCLVPAKVVKSVKAANRLETTAFYKRELPRAILSRKHTRFMETDERASSGTANRMHEPHMHSYMVLSPSSGG